MGSDALRMVNRDSSSSNEDADKQHRNELKANAYKESDEKTRAKRDAKKNALKNIIILALVLGFILAITTNIAKPLVRPLLPSPADEQYFLKYMQVAEIIVIGYFTIEIVGSLAYKLALIESSSSEQTAKSMKSIIRIAGAVIVIAFIISFLSQDPVIAASISTISGLVIGFAASNIIGNAIGGIYLAIVRPFRIGDRIKVFGETGIVNDIGLLYTQLILENGEDRMLASNSSMVSNQIILKKRSREQEVKGELEERDEEESARSGSSQNSSYHRHPSNKGTTTTSTA